MLLIYAACYPVALLSGWPFVCAISGVQTRVQAWHPERVVPREHPYRVPLRDITTIEGKGEEGESGPWGHHVVVAVLSIDKLIHLPAKFNFL